MTVHNVNSLSPDSAANVLDCRKEAVMNKKGITILYSRLSVDDEREGNSGSIENQKMLLEAYADKNGLTPHIHVFDDGYSGTGWDRPGWLKIMEEVEAGHVQNIVCKNLDRLGRDYIRVGLLLERFQEAKVRFIAVEEDTVRDKFRQNTAVSERS